MLQRFLRRLVSLRKPRCPSPRHAHPFVVTAIIQNQKSRPADQPRQIISSGSCTGTIRNGRTPKIFAAWVRRRRLNCEPTTDCARCSRSHSAPDLAPGPPSAASRASPPSVNAAPLHARFLRHVPLPARRRDPAGSGQSPRAAPETRVCFRGSPSESETAPFGCRTTRHLAADFGTPIPSSRSRSPSRSKVVILYGSSDSPMWNRGNCSRSKTTTLRPCFASKRRRRAPCRTPTDDGDVVIRLHVELLSLKGRVGGRKVPEKVFLTRGATGPPGAKIRAAQAS